MWLYNIYEKKYENINCTIGKVGILDVVSLKCANETSSSHVNEWILKHPK